MFRLMGAALILGGAAWFGFQASRGLGRRVEAVSEMAEGLLLLEQELELEAPALEVLLTRLIPRSRGPAQAMFRGCLEALDRLEEERFAQVWRRFAEGQVALGREGQECLIPLGESLGRCSCGEQRQAVKRCRVRLEEVLRRAEEDQRRFGRVYQALGLSGGAFLVILLL